MKRQRSNARQHPSVTILVMTLYTIGHSTHPIEAFLGLLTQHEIAILLDVRSFPGSRRWPQFNRDELKALVEQAGLRYEWCKPLGGRRHSSASHSPHSAWQHAAFRAYAEYADTAEFTAAIEHLCGIAVAGRSAIMCSEGLWWRCHRRIISDSMTARGWEVRHIMPDGKLVPHVLADFATVRAGRVIYDGGQHALNLK
jgi:uncharacterized protein (DUF488 family)